MMLLRDYQKLCVRCILRGIQQQLYRMYVTLPTGTGKSEILATIALQRQNTGRTLVLIHRQDIAKQLAATLRKKGLHVGLVMQGKSEWNCPIIVATVQSLSLNNVDTLLHCSEQPISTILIDESHHAVQGSTYEHILMLVEKAYHPLPISVVGFTATPYRNDKQSMLSLLPTYVFARDIPDMIRAGYLAPLIWERVQVNIDLETIVTTDKDGETDYAASALAAALVHDALTKDIVQQVVARIEHRPTLLFAASVQHAEQFAEEFRAQGISAQAVSGKLNHEQREQIFTAWRNGDIQVICNCSLLTEGFDFPQIAALVIARPTLSPSLYMQMLGRGLRPVPGKQDCLVLDVVGNNPDPGQQVILPHIVGDIQAQGGHTSSGHTTTSDPLLKALYGTDTPGLSLLDPIGQSHYRWLPYQLNRFEGYLARISQYEKAIIERDPEGSGLYRSRLYENQPGEQGRHTWIEHHYVPLRQQVALMHEATATRYIKALGGREADWLHRCATEKQLQVLQRLDSKTARQAREQAWTGQRVSDLITFLPMRRVLTTPPALPEEEENNDVA